MTKFVAAGLAAFLLVLAGLALTASDETHAGLPTDTPTDTPAATTPAATTPAATTPAATTAAPTGTATGTATASPTATAQLPAAAPQTGGNPGSGSDTLLLTLALGAAAIVGLGGVFAGKFALDRRN